MGLDEDPLVETLAPGQSFAIIDVARIVPAAAPPLAEIPDRVKGDLAQRRALDRARAVAASIVAKINAGTPARQAFAERSEEHTSELQSLMSISYAVDCLKKKKK